MAIRSVFFNILSSFAVSDQPDGGVDSLDPFTMQQRDGSALRSANRLATALRTGLWSDRKPLIRISLVRLPLAVLCLTATPVAAQTYPFEGSRVCAVSVFTFTADTCLPGEGGDLPDIDSIPDNRDGRVEITMTDGHVIYVSPDGDGTMGWLSGKSGASFTTTPLNLARGHPFKRGARRVEEHADIAYRRRAGSQSASGQRPAHHPHLPDLAETAIAHLLVPQTRPDHPGPVRPDRRDADLAHGAANDRVPLDMQHRGPGQGIIDHRDVIPGVAHDLARPAGPGLRSDRGGDNLPMRLAQVRDREQDRRGVSVTALTFRHRAATAGPGQDIASAVLLDGPARITFDKGLDHLAIPKRLGIQRGRRVGCKLAQPLGVPGRIQNPQTARLQG